MQAVRPAEGALEPFHLIQRILLFFFFFKMRGEQPWIVDPSWPSASLAYNLTQPSQASSFSPVFIV